MRYLLLPALFATVASAASLAPARVEYLRTIPSVREFTKPKNFFVKVFQWVVGEAEGKPEIVRPYSTTHDSTGRLLIADPGQRGVHIFDFEKKKYQFLKPPKSQPFQSPIDVVCDTQDNIYVSDSTRAQIYVFDTKGKYLRAIGSQQLKRPTGMAIDSVAKRLYLTDTLRHQVLVFGLDGSLVREIGKRGTAPGEFNYPTALTLSKGKVFVVDAMNFRIQSFTLDGNYAGSFGKLGVQTGTLNRPKGIAADTNGNLYIVDALFETVQVFDPQGRLLYYFGSTGKKPGQFQLPTGISITNRNVIYIADSYNQRVQVFLARRAME